MAVRTRFGPVLALAVLAGCSPLVQATTETDDGTTGQSANPGDDTMDATPTAGTPTSAATTADGEGSTTSTAGGNGSTDGSGTTGDGDGTTSSGTTGEASQCQYLFASEALSYELTEFPTLVVLDPAALSPRDCEPANLVLRDSEGSPLLIEIEAWATGGPAYVWARVPTIDAEHDRLALDCGGVARAPDPAAVWAGVYEAVWHMTGDGTTLVDSLGTWETGFDSEPQPTAGEGQVGPALDFAPGNDPIFTLSGTDDIDPGAVTVEAWVYPRTASMETNRRLVTKFDFFSLDLTTSGLPPRFSVYGNAGGMDGVAAVAPAALPVDEWTYLVGVFDASTPDVLLSVNAGPPILGGMQTNLPPGGNSQLRLAQRLDGLLDEVRISSVAHPPAWIEAQYWAMTGQLLEPSAGCR